MQVALRLLWRDAGAIVLDGTAIGQLLAGIVGVRTAFGLAADTSFLSIPIIFGACGCALLLTGALTLTRLRLDLIRQVLGALAASAFALAGVFLARPGGDNAGDELLCLAVLAAIALVLVHLFRELFPEEHHERPAV